MRHIRKALAVIAAAAAVTFTQTAVFAANDYPFATDRAGYVETTNLAGSGTLADPYIAYNAGQLKWVFKNGGYARLGKDITLTGDDAATLYVYSDEVHLDLAGFTYTVNFSNGGCVIDTGQSNTLYITDSKSGGAIRTNGTAIRAGISAKVHINGGTLAADGRAVFAAIYSKIHLTNGTLSSGKAAIYLNGASFYQYGGTVTSTASDIESAIEYNSYYDSGVGTPTTTARNTLILQSGVINKLYIPFKSATIYACITNISIPNGFGYEIPSAGADSIFYNKDLSACSANLANAVEAAMSGNLKELKINEAVLVSQSKAKVPIVEITNDVTPVIGKTLVYPTAPSGAHYSFDCAWYDYSGTKISGTCTSTQLYNKFTLRGTINTDSSAAFDDPYFYTPALDNGYCECGITQKSDSQCEFTITFPMTPVFTVQPKDKANVLLYSTQTFTAKADNAISYKWYLLDTQGSKVNWDTANEYGIVAALDDSQNTDTLKISIKSTYANGFSVYCEAHGNANTADSVKAAISLRKPSITVQPAPAGTGFSISTQNADTYEWCLTDENGVDYTWYEARTNGWGYPRDGSEWTSFVKLFSMGKNLEGKKVYCKVTGNGYTIYSDKSVISGFVPVTVPLNAYGLQIPFPGVEFSLDGITTESNGYELEDIALCYGKDCTRVTDKYVDFSDGKEYYYAATFAPKQGYCFTEDTIADTNKITGFCTNKNYKYTGTIRRQLVDGKISVLLVPTFVQSNGYRNTAPLNVVPSQNNLIVRNLYDATRNSSNDLAAMGAPNYKYSLDGTNWYTLPEINDGDGPFGGLNRNTGYTVYFKNADTDYIFKVFDTKTLSIKGDVDENGTVENADSRLLLKHIANGTLDELSTSQKMVAEMNNDNTLDILDVIEILKIIV